MTRPRANLAKVQNLDPVGDSKKRNKVHLVHLLLQRETLQVRIKIRHARMLPKLQSQKTTKVALLLSQPAVGADLDIFPKLEEKTPCPVNHQLLAIRLARS